MNLKQIAELQTIITQSLDKNIEVSVEKYVNGKICKLDEKIDEYIKNDIAHREEYKIETLEWRQKIEKKVEPLDNLNGFSKTSLYLLGFLGSVGGIVLIALKLLHGNK